MAVVTVRFCHELMPQENIPSPISRGNQPVIASILFLSNKEFLLLNLSAF